MAFILLTACASGGGIMTMDSFDFVEIGASKEEVIEKAGTPYSISKKPDGSEEYEYIERIKVGNRNLETRRYLITVKEGKVVSKKVDTSTPLPYYLESFDSYDMQTSQNDSP
jgi:outer membrane protein assembly factor BamE (lipoprotein component of BamABCDE complex)